MREENRKITVPQHLRDLLEYFAYEGQRLGCSGIRADKVWRHGYAVGWLAGASVAVEALEGDEEAAREAVRAGAARAAEEAGGGE